MNSVEESYLSSMVEVTKKHIHISTLLIIILSSITLLFYILNIHYWTVSLFFILVVIGVSIMSLISLTVVYLITKYTPEKIIKNISTKMRKHNMKVQKLALVNFIFIAIISIYLSISLSSDANITISVLDTTSKIHIRQTIQLLTILIVIGTISMIKEAFDDSN